MDEDVQSQTNELQSKRFQKGRLLSASAIQASCGGIHLLVRSLLLPSANHPTGLNPNTEVFNRQNTHSHGPQTSRYPALPQPPTDGIHGKWPARRLRASRLIHVKPRNLTPVLSQHMQHPPRLYRRCGEMLLRLNCVCLQSRVCALDLVHWQATQTAEAKLGGVVSRNEQPIKQ